MADMVRNIHGMYHATILSEKLFICSELLLSAIEHFEDSEEILGENEYLELNELAARVKTIQERIDGSIAEAFEVSEGK